MPKSLRTLQLVIIAVITAAGCATTPKPPAAPEEQSARSEQGAAKPGMSIDVAMGRETAALPLRDVPFPDGAFKVEATATPKVTPQEGFVQVEIPIGTEEDLSCFVYPDHLDTGAMLMAFVGN